MRRLRAAVFRLGRKISPCSSPGSNLLLQIWTSTNRNEPTASLVAKLIIQLARNGERDPTRLAKRAIAIVRGSS